MACLALSTLACGSSDDEEPEAKRNWQTLVSGDWKMPEGQEGYTCVRHTVEEDLYVNAFEAINPLGTHHTLLTMGGRAESGEPDGISKCNASTNGTLAVFASGVGTNPLVFPPGVALKIPAGTQLLLNLHLFNTGREGEIAGLSGTRISTVPVEEVEHFAEGILAGPIGLNLPPGETTTTTGYCTMSQDTTLFAVAPHMHQLGTYERVFAETAGGEVTLFDAPYDFDEQSFTSLEQPLQLKAGDRLRVECTHQNTTTQTVRFGESSLEEMCFAGVYRYPGDGKLFICFDFPR